MTNTIADSLNHIYPTQPSGFTYISPFRQGHLPPSPSPLFPHLRTLTSASPETCTSAPAFPTGYSPWYPSPNPRPRCWTSRDRISRTTWREPCAFRGMRDCSVIRAHQLFALNFFFRVHVLYGNGHCVGGWENRREGGGGLLAGLTSFPNIPSARMRMVDFGLAYRLFGLR